LTAKLKRGATWGGFFLSLTLLLSIIFLSIRTASSFIENTRWVAHSYRVLQELAGVESALLDEQTASRSLRLTGNVEYQLTADEAVVRLRRHLELAFALVADNPAQAERILELKETAAGANWHGTRVAFVARPQVLSITSRLRQAREEENRLLQMRIQESENSALLTRILNLGGGGLAILTLVIAFFLVQKRARDSDETSRAILDTAVDAIITIDESGKVFSCNPASERLLGYSKKELIGKNISVIMPEPYSSSHDSYLEKYRRTGIANIIGIGREVSARRKNGTVFPVHLSIGALYISSRRYFTGILRDITHLKDVEYELNREKNFLSTVLATAGALIAVLDSRGYFLRANDAFSDFLDDHSFLASGGKRYIDIVTREDQPYLESLVEGIQKTGNPVEYECRVVSLSGETRRLAGSISAIMGDDSRIEFLICTGIDITERKRREDEIQYLTQRVITIQEEERMRISGDLHDSVGQALAAIKFLLEDLFIEISEESRKKGRQVFNYVSEAIAEVRSISHALSPISYKRLGLTRAIEDLARTFRGGKLSIDVACDDLETIFPEKWDTNAYRIVQEAMVNIFKHSGASHVEILTARSEDNLKLIVRDNGRGMEPGGERRVGLGMLLMRERAHLLGAEMTVKSSHGKGTEIVLEFQKQ